MDFRPLADAERRQLIAALRGNTRDGQAIRIDRHDTTFEGTINEVSEDEVIDCIRSIPCHY